MTDSLDDIKTMTAEFGELMAQSGRELGYAVAITDVLTVLTNLDAIPAESRLALFAELSALKFTSPRPELARDRHALQQHSNTNHKPA